ncbi:MAG: SDR family NAD(P)-dependent oxidoreductase, partial [Proteobacteria bacterium]|nr:SDR family NAD(P)-dependent oxidoreductase [Pseudomonadota bacterium]
MKIKNKVALVLGAVKGIGKGIGLALAQEGADVALNYFDWEESLDDLHQEFAKTGRDHLIIQTNLLEIDKIPGLVNKVV